MAGTKRERDLHRQKLARQQKELAEAKARRRRLFQIGGAVVGVLAVVVAVGVIAAATGSNSSGSSSASTPSAAPTVAATSTAGVKCKPVNKLQPLTTTYPKYEGSLFTGGKYVENMDTNCGRIVFTMDSTNAPETTKAVAFLSDRKFYDNTQCHRLTTGGGNFVLQCGDPKGDGTGGPGFKVPDENLPQADGQALVTYPRGTVAMANAGPGTTGSQFFIVYRDSQFPPNYTRLGTVTQGMNVVDYVASKGTVDGSADGRPKQPLQITKMQSAATVEQQAPQ